MSISHWNINDKAELADIKPNENMARFKLIQCTAANVITAQ